MFSTVGREEVFLRQGRGGGCSSGVRGGGFSSGGIEEGFSSGVRGGGCPLGLERRGFSSGVRGALVDIWSGRRSDRG